MIKIQKVEHLSSEQLAKLRSIFFETSSVKEFSSEEAKEKFYEKYLGLYLKLYPDFFLCALEEGELLGYVCCCPDTKSFPNYLELFPYYESLDKKLEVYPAHLHINLGEMAQGKGLGSSLIKELIKEITRCNINGIHIFTGQGHPSVNFYRKNGFCDELSVEYNSSKILFMGCVVSSKN